jgi:hypothetical protein
MPEKPKFPNCEKYDLVYLRDLMSDAEFGFIEDALSRAEAKGKATQYTATINLFNKLRNTRFVFNDEVKMVIDMLKDEMTRLSK